MQIFRKEILQSGRLKFFLFNKKVFSIKITSFSPKSMWRKNNPHNETVYEGSWDVSRCIVGKRTYGVLNIEMANNGNEKVIIGNYCSIGPRCCFILASEHPYKGISTFPFKVKLGLQKYEAKSKGSIILEDDVWLGYGCIINSGVHIGKGAIIASGSVITKDVEPYSIYGGNPAKFIKYRFNENIRNKLLSFDFSKLDEEKIRNSISYIYEELNDDNIDLILKRIKDAN